jgi:hypothetical protein
MLRFSHVLPMAMAAALLAPGASADDKDGEKQRRERASREYRDEDRRARDGYYEGDYGRARWGDDGYWRDDRYGRDDKEWRKAQKDRAKERRKDWKEAEKDRREAEREWAEDQREAEREWLKDQREAEREWEKNRREARRDRRDRDGRYPYPY